MNVHDVGGRRRHEDNELTLRIYPGNIAEGTIYCPVTARKNTSAAEVIEILINKLHLDKTKCYVLAEVKEFGGEEWILNPTDCPVQRVMLWPRNALENRFSSEDYRFLLREKNLDGSIHYSNLQSWLKVTEERRRMMERGFLPQPQQKDYDDLCNLPDLNEKTLLDNLRNRFKQEKIYTYVGTILIAINPFKFLPIYNPKYVKMYDNHPLGKLEPHIYAIADVAYHAMLQCRKNQCIVISGESGSGKTQSTNFLIHHLTALSQKGFASGVEQIILGAGPVLEAFGNAKTAHNNNSSRFGKFIQVNYQETGTVRGAYVEKYLLEKSRLVYQEHNERNYHVFYYLLAGASEEEKKSFHLLEPEEYHYLNQMTQSPYRKTWDDYYYDSEPDSFTVEGEDLKHDFERLQLAMEMVGFLPKTRKQIFSLLSAILHLGNIKYKRKTFRDDSIDICNPEVLPIVSELLEVKDEMLFEALTTRKTVTVGDRLILPYKLSEAVTVRDSMAKSLYSALFDWIVFRINHALLNNRNLEEHIKILSIGVLDIFGFEDYENNSFEQFCINFANERLQHYFNQHIFKLEQEEYRAEGISWHNIDYIDNSSCINLISKKPTGLLHLLDEECNFPQATNQTLLDKFKRQNEGNNYIEFPAVMEPAFIIKHYAGKVKYQVKDFREKNTDHMRPDIVALLKSSKNAFICSLIGIDPVAGFRWAVLRSYFRAAVAFREAGKRYVEKRPGHDDAVPLPVLKSVDSFSFLHHPVHQRSLEILQRCKEEKYSKAPNPTILSDIPHNCSNELHGMSWNGRTGVQAARLSSSHSLIDDEGIFLSSASSKLLERAHGILMRNRYSKSKPALPKHLLDVRTLKYIASMTLHDRITKSLLHLHKKKKPPSISAQFQASLNKLMETLGQAEPYFVKCIRSNAEKLPLRFNDHLVLRQLRYTGMLETVRIRQSGYSIKYSFQEFVDHFHVLLLQGTVPSQCSIQEFMREADLNPDNYQVGKTMIFTKESERQRLQSMLHTEVVRRIVLLQSWFRAVLERKLFLQMKRAAVVIQIYWQNYKMRQNLNETNHTVLNTAATSIQATWKSYQQRKTFVQMRAAATIIQRSWQQYWRRRLAALCLQIAWRRYRDMRAYRALRQIIIRFQAVSRGYLTRQRFRLLTEGKLGEQEKELEGENNGTLNQSSVPHDQTEEFRPEYNDSSVDVLGSTSDFANSSSTVQGVLVRERPKSLSGDPDKQKVVRAKRHSRRMRELEQAIFSLELLKVRSGGVSPSEERRWSTEQTADSANSLSPQGTPDSESSRGSFEVPSCEDSEKRKESVSDEPTFDINSTSPKLANNQSSFQQLNSEDRPTSPKPNDILPSCPRLVCSHSYLQMPNHLSSSHLPNDFFTTRTDHFDATVGSKTGVELEEGDKDLCLQPSLDESPHSELPAKAADELGDTVPEFGVLEKLEQLNVQQAERQKQKQQQNEKEMMDQIRQQKEILEKQRKVFERQEKDLFERQRGEALQKIEQNRQNDSPPISLSSPSRGGNKSQLFPVSHPEKKCEPNITSDSLSTSAIELKMLSTPEASENEGTSGQSRAKDRTISMFFETKGGFQESNKSDGWSPKISLEAREPAAGVERVRQPKAQKAIGGGRMRFWGNRKQGEKKVSREKLATQSEIQDLPSGYDPIQHNLTPPRSPDLGLERGKEFKENKEPSPKVRRRRSVKISNVGLEPIHWQHDALQIITSANDFKSMNEFLQKKITDLETDDCKKDTFVDVVFKKSLKEFRLNIFNSYSTALAMDDGKSIRYKDLYALFEQILEKTLRQERRGWNESPVKVWVNTFKVFLDEFMTEYKTLENSTGKVPKVERKKRRKKESDIVEEYNGHVFKSTQYSIPTYCECCSSLIWMMDRAYVCKCKCILMCHGIYSPSLSLTLLVTPQYDPELSSRQFGVEVSRLTNDERTVPLVAEKLINYIEMHGLYTEGIYRKSGSTNKIKELKQGLDTDISSMNLDEYSIHVIASVFKQWLRDLPNPLMTFELYDECLRAMGLQDRKEILRGVYSIIDQLSRSHLSTLERLIFHLVRIALQEDTNRMSSNALAIVFAPCILRCPDTTDPLQSVQDISKTTACVELIIVEQMNKYRARLKDINSLEFAENKAKNRLSLIRRSIGKGRLRRSNYASPASPVSVRLPSVADVPEETNTEETTDIDMTEQQQAAMQQEERTLTEQIETLQKEKEELTFEMLALEPRASDDETLESEASIGTADSSENLNMDSEGAQSERSERSSVISSVSQQRAEAVSRLRRPLRKQADSVESIDSAVHSSASSSASSVPQGGRRFRFRSKSPSPAVYRSHVNCSPDGEARYSQGGKGLEDFPQFTSRGTFNPEKGKHKLKILKRSVQKPKDSPDGASGMGKKRNSEPEYGAPQQLVVFGKNEFMV
uniref:Myosin IXAa n=1 Tax=Callorhinchus milii TaxID=7868 RepID=A0A4W3HZ27_CALMI